MLSRSSQTLFTASLSCASCFLAASTTPPQASTPRRVPALCDEILPASRQHGCRRQRILSFEVPVLFPSHARRQSDADSTDRVAPIAPSVSQNQHLHQDKMGKSPKAACVPPREWIPLIQLFHICDFSLPTRLCPFFFKGPKFGLCPAGTTDFSNTWHASRSDSITPSSNVSFLGLVLDGPIGINYTK